MDLRRKGSFCGVKRTSALRHTFSPPPIVIDKLWLNTIYTLTSNGRHYGFLNYRFLPIEIGYKVGLSLQWSVSSNSDLPIGTVISLEDNTVVWWLPSAYCSLLLLCFISPRVYQQEECHLLAWVLATERAIEQQRVKTYLTSSVTTVPAFKFATGQQWKCWKWSASIITLLSAVSHQESGTSMFQELRVRLVDHLQVDHVFKQIWCQGAVSISSASILLSLDLKRDDL
jgi:hypothetical protein